MLTQQPIAVSLLARFRNVRQATMHFCVPLTPEDMMVQSCAEASPVKWHLAHTSWFFETFVLSEFVAAYQLFDPEFRWLFNSYYKSLGEMPEKKLRASFSRPPLDQVLAYRCHVDAAIARLLEQTPEDEALRRIALGLEHEQQHIELIATDIKHALFTNPLHPAYIAAGPPTGDEAIAPPLQWRSFSPGYPVRPGVVEVGVTPHPASIASFAFDNETPRHSVYLAPFRLASRLTTCAEYLAFLDEDGYSRPELWLSEGWDTMRAELWQAPLYWQRDSGTKSGWSVYTMHGVRPLDELSETPVCHLSFFEADAFARWAGHRLPTEFEWELAAAGAALGTGIAAGLGTGVAAALGTGIAAGLGTGVAAGLGTGVAAGLGTGVAAGLGTGVAAGLGTGVAAGFSPRNSEPKEPGFSPGSSPIIGNLLESNHLHPQPAPAARGPQQLFGDVWEWTQSPYTGYPGYKPLPGALGEYNGKFMSSQMVLRGGSCVTPQTHIRATYRNFFPPGTRWQFSGLRLARDGAG